MGKTIIAGSRTITDSNIIKKAIKESNFNITEIVSGCARGVDSLGEEYAKLNNIPIKRFSPNWKLYGKFAGIKRNREMADYADSLIAIWNGKSRGTKNMIDEANMRGLNIYVYKIKD